MKRSELVASQLERYGNTVTVTPKNGSPITCKAMIQPLSLRRLPNSEEMGVIGTNKDSDGMVYIGPLSCRLDQFPRGTTVAETGGAVYRVVNARCMTVGDAPIYVWAILQEAEKEGSPWSA